MTDKAILGQIEDLTRMKLFVTMTEIAHSVLESDDIGWEAKFEFVFSRPIKGIINDLGFKVSYSDPDGSYEDDVRAYVSALAEKSEELKGIIRIMENRTSTLLDELEVEGQEYIKANGGVQAAAALLDDLLAHNGELERRAERRAMCGRYIGRRIDPLTGLIVRFAPKCELWRDCECQVCFNDRKQDFIMRLRRAVTRYGAVGLYPGWILEEEGVNYTKDTYLRFPFETEDAGPGCLVAMPVEFYQGRVKIESCGAVMESAEDIEADLNWDTLANTPRGKRVSGDLGKPEPDGPEGEEIEVYEIIVEGLTKPEEEEAAKEAIEATSYLDPKQADELRNALEERTAAYKKAVRARGGRADSWRTRVFKVDLARISWKNHTAYFLPDKGKF